MSRLSFWGYPKGEPLKVIKLPNKIVNAIQAAKTRLSGGELIRLLNSEATQDRDSWQTIPLSKVIELSLLLRSDFEEPSDSSLSECYQFDYFKNKTIKAYTKAISMLMLSNGQWQRIIRRVILLLWLKPIPVI